MTSASHVYADHPFEKCNLRFCDGLECARELSPGKFCGLPKDAHPPVRPDEEQALRERMKELAE